MAKLSQLTIPVKNPSSGVVTSQTFNLAGSGGGGSDTNFIGTKAEYDALPSSEKENYDSMDFTDYHDGLNIDPTPMINSKNPVASGGVYSAIQTLSNSVNEDIEELSEGVTDAIELVAPLESTLVASRAYAIGDQFVYDGFLYKVTAAIALDDPIVIGTNCTLAPNVIEQISDQVSDLITTINGLQSQVEALTADTGWVSVNSAIAYRKKGNVVTLWIVMSTASSWSSIGTLPAGIRPAHNFYQCGFTAIGGASSNNIYIEASSGVVKVYGNTAVTTYITYLV